MNFASTDILNHLVSQTIITLKQLKHVHARIIRFNLLHDNYLINILLRLSFNFTSQHNNNNYSQLVFTQTPNPNTYVYNTFIRGLVSNNQFHESIETFYSMRVIGFLPNSFTFPFVLKACGKVLDLNLGVNLHTLMVKVGFDVDMRTGLVCCYAKCGRLDYACKVFDEMPEKNVVCLGAIVGGYVDAGRYNDAVAVFKRLVMGGTGLRPDSFVIVRVLSACSKVGDLENVEWLDGCMRGFSIGRNIFVGTALVDAYAKCGNMEKAVVAFDQMVEKDAVTWGAMIQGYASNGKPKEALDVFYRMRNDNINPDCYTIVGVLSACSSLGALDLGESALTLVNKNEFLYNPVVGTALIDMYAKCGKMGRAWRVFREMKLKDVIVWNAAITGLAMSGETRVLFGVLGQMEKLGFHPDGKTFIGILCGCVHGGLVDDGKQYFNNMKRVYSVTPSIEHYGCMVDLLGRAGLLNEAHLLIKDMPMEPNAIVWGALLNGCRLHRDTELAEYVLKCLIELEPWNSGNYVLLSNVFSDNKKWEEAQRIRSTMIHRNIKKIPGCCWIEVNGIVHEFLVGDTYHPMSERIYAKLSELTKEVKQQMGYTPTTEFALYDVEDEEKEHFLNCHSEKLAIVFGLISTKPGDVIRVVKNIRVCGDCHVAIKHFSKITGREISLRDNSRFHTFIDGSCSCGDYW
uniref:putative pentatricopeptide repeat-containing protein At3g08820 n=1 Tax=Erigeron canadensis TaxID=72917 RepID=UPI001CB91AB3|nr:putative pentatricopeptide repeat-containing protein At3g08820 [Erigeron canadensis]